MENKILKKRLDNYINRTDVLINSLTKALVSSGSQDIYEFTEEDKKRAAYALNMCMVSVSQIVDYNDINILEQEYEAILNNLNLEKIPKDEALLHILKQILDTITYFRIQEGDKKLIEKEYQHKMKNAIWSAVPNLGILFTGDPISIAFSLANQVGIGYMNYRRNKAENELGLARQMWQLQRSAIEQFNVLRRELFDTAWRLADTYNFPDDYRLTEKQIKQYNSILMDSNEIRKYERLEAVKDKFEAYPPFWYFIGNTANYIAENIKDISPNSRTKFRERALYYFEKYMELDKYNILREDQLASSCALEHVELLLNTGDNDYSKIKRLLSTAANMSGNALDVLQLCAVNYLRIGDSESAEKYLRILVNEDYNRIINAQLLSGIYVNKKNETDYDLLKTRVNGKYLYPMPKGNQNLKLLEKSFEQKQGDVVLEKYNKILNEIIQKAKIEWKSIVEFPQKNGGKNGIKVNEDIFNSGKRAYLKSLENGKFQLKLVELLRAFLRECYDLAIFKFRGKPEILKEFVNPSNQNNLKIKEVLDNINKMQRKINSAEEFTFEDYNSIQQIPFNSIMTEIVDYLQEIINDKICHSELKDIQLLDSALVDFCRKNQYKEPEILIDTDNTNEKNNEDDVSFVDVEIFGAEAVELQNRYEQIERLRKEAMNFCQEKTIILDKQGAKLYFENDFKEYFNTKNEIKALKEWAILIIGGVPKQSKQKCVDLIFLPGHIIRIEDMKIKGKHCEEKLKAKDDGDGIIIEKRIILPNYEYSNPSVDYGVLISLFDTLKEKTPKDLNNKVAEILQ